MRLVCVAYRAHEPRWAWSPISGEGARLHGGRFNPKGVPALYLALSILGAVREASPFGPMRPVTLCAYEADLDPVLDGRDPSALAAVAATPDELDCPNWRAEMAAGRAPASHRLAMRLRTAGFVGLVYPSFARGAGPEDANLVLWRWGDAPPARLRVTDPDQRLPRDSSSWP